VFLRFLGRLIVLPCSAMHKHDLCTFVHSVETNKHMFLIFSPADSHTSLVFPYQMLWQYSNRDPLNGGVECRWGRQKSQFRQISGYQISECWSVIDNGGPCSLSHRPPRISESCLPQPAWTTTTKRREENRI